MEAVGEAIQEALANGGLDAAQVCLQFPTPVLLTSKSKTIM